MQSQLSRASHTAAVVFALAAVVVAGHPCHADPPEPGARSGADSVVCPPTDLTAPRLEAPLVRGVAVRPIPFLPPLALHDELVLKTRVDTCVRELGRIRTNEELTGFGTALSLAVRIAEGFSSR